MIEDRKLVLPLLHVRGPHPAGASYPTNASNGDYYSDDENEFILAVARFRAVNGISSPTLCQLLWVAKQIGYTRPGGDFSQAADVPMKGVKARPRVKPPLK